MSISFPLDTESDLRPTSYGYWFTVNCSDQVNDDVTAGNNSRPAKWHTKHENTSVYIPTLKALGNLIKTTITKKSCHVLHVVQRNTHFLAYLSKLKQFPYIIKRCDNLRKYIRVTVPILRMITVYYRCFTERAFRTPELSSRCHQNHITLS